MMPAVARYTRFVSLSKNFLWILVVAMIGLVVWIASDSDGESGARVVFSNVPKSEILQNMMSNPHYQGMDARNRPYTVTADKARQLDKDNVALENIRADMGLDDGVWLSLNAGSGTLNILTKQLELHDGVNVFYDKGYEFRTDHVKVDIEKASAYGDSPVEGQGPMGILKADGFTVSNHGKSIHFNGSVRIRLYR
jgi:lipopolysaccharide export system protein LptC